MSDEVREYIRAAQQAEMRKDAPAAVDHLRKAAAIYRNRGLSSRALQMLRHARSLDPERKDVEEEIRRLEWLPDEAMTRAVRSQEGWPPDDETDEVMAEVERALQPLEQLEGKPPAAAFPDRGPTLADRGLAAWCSFCCKPKTEIGELVAGPAGAFICKGCLTEGTVLLGGPASPAAGPDAPQAPVARPGGPAGVLG